ncbi:MAG: preprotein translocase subunit SecE [Amphiplicatus sp.]
MATKKKSSGDGVIEGSAEEVKKKKKPFNPAEFFNQVIAEGRKVTWTSRNETMISTIMVLIMVVVMSLFFLAVDWVLRAAVTALLSIG